MAAHLPTGFSSSHTNWLGIGTGFLGVGAAGIMGLILAAHVDASFWPQPWFRVGLAISSACAGLGLYAIGAPFAGAPIPEPSVETRVYWQRGFVLLAGILVLALSYATYGFVSTGALVIVIVSLTFFYVFSPVPVLSKGQVNAAVREAESAGRHERVERLQAERDAAIHERDEFQGAQAAVAAYRNMLALIERIDEFKAERLSSKPTGGHRMVELVQWSMESRRLYRETVEKDVVKATSELAVQYGLPFSGPDLSQERSLHVTDLDRIIAALTQLVDSLRSIAVDKMPS